MTERLASRRAPKRTCVPTVQKGLLIQFPDEGEIGDGHDGTSAKGRIREIGFSDPMLGPSSSGRDRAESPDVADHPPAYRKVIAGWNDTWRERWGLRANSLEEIGFSWRDAETQAFVEVWKQIRENSVPDDTIAVKSPGCASAELN